ncbi:4Fe-4S ferredoxin iron-sulfur binding domain protein [Catenulispora acidiphila DSM 44928]|uniref:Glycolate oxidase iron-sulfur subunit n=1 Tax=Catenulispora acidiphila (strain DSM 44928 / JCM 14897 / NBRC 102108 / NRRL B-24433 / ID139908) TaxID=479433 RepID=C7PW10_CATAD|nr:(Fe-S)-binding protein [Catenulispora acidiphila]ACU71402.1 4Fe-4S ferredoxin iron-sulfur binding domain protein [Catenulispora acidiphila DSM 44928]
MSEDTSRREMPESEPAGIFSKDLLDACISCGFCLPACPTYALTGQEQSSPRGRITLMRLLETGDLAADDPTLAEEASLCLGCRACETVCPAGVQYGHLLEEWRDEQWSGLKRPWIVRPLLLVANRKWVLRLLGLVRRSARKRSGSSSSSSGTSDQPTLMLGCFERALFPSVSRNIAALDPNLTVDPDQGCCGALHAHNGDLDQGRDLARKLGEQLPGTIVTTSGGCAAHLADVIGRDRVVEASEWLLKQDTATAQNTAVARSTATEQRPLRVGLQDSCHLRNGLGVWREPRELLGRTATYVELPSAGSCCGAAGTYALVRKKESKAILAKKIAEIEAADLDLVIAVNPGCLRQLQTGLRKAKSRTKAVHIVDYQRGDYRRGDKA